MSWTAASLCATISLMASCEALLRSGTACRSAALTDSAFCSHHATLVEEIGEERVRSGDHPRRRQSTVTEPLVAEVETTLASGNGHADPAQVRPRLAEAAAASLDDISTALLDAALGATREMWVTTACSGCGKKQRVEVKIPDVRSRELLRSSFSSAKVSGVRLRPRKRRVRACPVQPKPSRNSVGAT